MPEAEKIPIPEAAPEKTETAAGQPSPERKGERVSLPAETPPHIQPAAPAAAAAVPQKDDVTMQVEGILEEDLGPIYASLPEDAKPLFREKGEQVAREISTMLQTLKVKAARILRLIRDWLHTIPKVNSFFLEQEAKIKTDRILAFQDKRMNEPPNA